MGSGSTRRYFALPGRLHRWSRAGRQLTSSWRDGYGAQPADTTHARAATRSPTHASPVELDPKECALLVLGCQPGILDELGDAHALLLKINAAIDIVRLHGGHLGFARIALDDLDYQFTPSTNKEFSALARQRRFQNGTPESAIHPALAVQTSDLVICTTRLGAFSTTDLDEQLTNLGVTTLIVLGAHTSGALLSTIREAADRDYRLIVLSDCCTDPDIDTHRFLMTRIFPRQAEITSAAALYASLAAEKVDKSRSSSTGATS